VGIFGKAVQHEDMLVEEDGNDSLTRDAKVHRINVSGSKGRRRIATAGIQITTAML
jgi:hypothetical protein